ncbi:uncharacterized protein STEHIDRAFT_121500 [Stereum hirsutum FP-91666 SS1]|uniref:uncharacterized protein n=1 Tax=Stereum hirsutum (strain FP-91666) TaxID=721885 RepID=UPI000440FAC7|nr:uncharacterized protein STEHIDRAFT_121500 [Stereum hirsutum FP-91666 SS1]EIM86604.1 hypothetical protein STEHIDRAFT_121500 [Stereum hirsutum FP-91666 SS1]
MEESTSAKILRKTPSTNPLTDTPSLVTSSSASTTMSTVHTDPARSSRPPSVPDESIARPPHLPSPSSHLSEAP